MSQPGISAQSHESSDEISLVELWQVVRRGWRVIAATTAIALAAATGFLLVTPAQYEAMGLIEVTEAIASVTPQKTVEYLKFPSTEQAILHRLAWDTNSENAKAFSSSPPATVRRGTNLIEVRARGSTPADALAALKAIIDQLRETHEGLTQPMLGSLELNLKVIRQEKEETLRLLKEYDRVAGLQARFEPRDRFSESLLYLQMISATQNRLADLAGGENDIGEKIQRIRGNPTRLMTEPTVGQRQVYPQTRSVMIPAMLGGSLLGLLVVSLHYARKRSDSRAKRT